ncbi:MAG: LysM peptidoglycan-binding domain-containing protein [Acidimicrobiia bacterium]|nr:LysM peptidoglycan-binding domain-containing protein [Acidimicrobiia bacterium]
MTLAGLSAVLVITLTACFDTGDDTEGPTTDTGGAGSNTVVTLAPPPPPETPATGVVQQPPASPPEPPPTTPATAQPARELGSQHVYEIQSGDTLFSIAQQFGVSLDDLVALNNIENPDNIRAGDQLFIPPPE